MRGDYDLPAHVRCPPDRPVSGKKFFEDPVSSPLIREHARTPLRALCQSGNRLRGFSAPREEQRALKEEEILSLSSLRVIRLD